MPSSTSTAPTRSKLRSTLCKGVAAIVVAAAVGASLFANDSVSASINEKRIERLNATIENIYTTDYQQMADDNLAKKRDAKEHTLDSIFIAANPYGTNTMSLYVYFTTDQTTSVSYTVHADGYPDFAQTVAQDEQYQTEHEFTVLGLIPGVKNTITFTSTDANGSMAARTVTRTGAQLLGVEEVRLEQTQQAASGTDLGDGLYAILGNDSNEQDFMFYYDTNGVLRSEIPLLYYRSHRLLFDDNGLMWFSASTKHFVGMNRLGKLEKIIDLGDRFILHHDYALDDDGNIVSLATDLTRSDHAVQDQVIKVNTSTGKVTKLVDFGEMFPDYKASTDHSGIDESDPTASGRWDWIHFNTIQLLPDGQYYINMFDNNFGYAMTRPDYDWTTIADISTAKSSKDKDSRSQYRRYLVDENADTYTEVSAFDVPYSPYVSSAQELDNGNILIDTGMQGLFGVYDTDGDLLAQYKMALNTSYVYRVYQYDFKGFYFA